MAATFSFGKETLWAPDTSSPGPTTMAMATDSADRTFWQGNYGANLIDLVFADLNEDGVVDELDEDISELNEGTGTTHAQGDAHGDGMVDGLHLAFHQSQFDLELAWIA